MTSPGFAVDAIQSCRASTVDASKIGCQRITVQRHAVAAHTYRLSCKMPNAAHAKSLAAAVQCSMTRACATIMITSLVL